VPPRQPYAGELVFTAFSGSHQDAIKKSWAQQKPGKPWDVLYIPIDPADIGRSYRAIIRINSQSGKGGVAYVLEQEFGFQLPKLMHKEIGRIVNDLADAKGTELTSADIRAPSSANTSTGGARRARALQDHRARLDREVRGPRIVVDGKAHTLTGAGNGPIDAFVRALAATALPKFDVVSYSEHSLGAGAEARAVSYIQIKMERGSAYFGAGIDTNIELASIKAIVSALNRAIRPRDEV
jgi:2-isopropylmalate synthase